MSEDKIERLLTKLSEKLQTDAIKDNFTGRIILNIQQGGLSPKLEVETEI
jgi:hypothetical protein